MIEHNSRLHKVAQSARMGVLAACALATSDGVRRTPATVPSGHSVCAPGPQLRSRPTHPPIRRVGIANLEALWKFVLSL
jgi:hypothetical protein